MAFFGTIALTAVLFVTIPKGFFPTQDTGLISGIMEAAQDASPAEMKRLQREVATVLTPGPRHRGVRLLLRLGQRQHAEYRRASSSG